MRPVLICFALLALAGCAQNPVSGQNDFVMMTESQEISMGRENDIQIRKQYKVYPSFALQDYVNSVGQKIAKKSHRPNLTYRFTVLDSPEINAFALPGGYVYITRGILAYLNSEAELAAVLGHEIGHVTARHGVRQHSAAQATNIGISIAAILVPELKTDAGHNLTNMLGGALLSGYGREHELEADRLGAQYLARTEYDPQAMIRVIGVLKNQELFDAEIAKQEGREPRRYHGTFASHPDNDTRLQQVVSEAAHLRVASPVESKAEFLKQTDGITFNDSIEEGIVRNNRFIHSVLGIALDFPNEWAIKNSPTQLIALSPKRDASIQLKLSAKPEESVGDFARRISDTVEVLNIDNQPAAIASKDAALYGVIYFSGKAFIIQCDAQTHDLLTAHRAEMNATIRSFHALSAEERKQVQPLTVKLVTAKAGDTYAKLAKASPLGKNAEQYLRLINANYPQGEPVTGQTLKIIE